jgi:hypothetical protein
MKPTFTITRLLVIPNSDVLYLINAEIPVTIATKKTRVPTMSALPPTMKNIMATINQIIGQRKIIQCKWLL